MNTLLRVSRCIDMVSRTIGRACIWLVLAAVVISAGNAIVRKFLGFSSNSWLEVQWYLFGGVFLLAAAYTLEQNQHVRIDFLYGSRSAKMQATINLFGHAFFLLPFCAVIVYLSVPWAVSSFVTKEVSSNAGGLPLWPAKVLVPAGFTLLFAQAVSEIIKSWDQVVGAGSSSSQNAPEEM